MSRRRRPAIATTRPQASTVTSGPGSVSRLPRIVVVLGAVLALVVLLIFSRAIGLGFVSFDDDVYVTANPQVLRGFDPASIQWAWTTTHAANWHPLTWLSHMLDVTLFGTNPVGHHAVNVLLHAANAMLLVMLLWRLGAGPWSAVGAAAVFALHPQRVESVAWIAERKDLLAGLCFFLTVLAYLSWVRRPSASRYALVLGCFAAGLAAKPMLVTLPVILLFLDVWPLGRLGVGTRPARLAALVTEKLPMFGLSAASALVTAYAQRAGGSMGTLDGLAPVERLANAAASVLAYLIQSVWPVHLAFFYPHPAMVAPGSSLLLGQGLIAALVVVGVSAVAWRERSRRPYLIVGWAWYLVMLVPVIGLVQVGMQARADRYTYLPMLGVVLAVTWLLQDGIRAQRLGRQPVAIVVGVMLLAFSALTWRQIGTWRDDRALAERALAVTQRNFVAHTLLAGALERAGERSGALEQLEAALQIRPGHAAARTQLGLILERDGRLDEAIAHLEAVVQARPNDPDALANLGVVRQRRGDLAAALRDFERALSLRPDHVVALNGRGVTRRRSGDVSGAIADFERALAIQPDNAEPHSNLGVIFRQANDLDRAAEHFDRALRLRPDSAEALNGMGSVLEQRGDLAAARTHFERAVGLRPNYVEARYNLGVVHARQADYVAAAAEFRAALAADPNYAPARAGLVRLTGLGVGVGESTSSR